MESGFVVYDTFDTKNRMIDEYVSFCRSVDSLSKAGISVTIITVSSFSEIPQDSEAYCELENESIAFPVSVFNGVLVDSDNYPSDQILADYLDVPSGIISAEKTSVPAGNDLMQSCSVVRKG